MKYILVRKTKVAPPYFSSTGIFSVRWLAEGFEQNYPSIGFWPERCTSKFWKSLERGLAAEHLGITGSFLLYIYELQKYIQSTVKDTPFQLYKW